MLLTPNKIYWPKCPYCNIEINHWLYIPAVTIANPHFNEVECPSCHRMYDLRIRVEMTAECYKLAEQSEAQSTQA